MLLDSRQRTMGIWLVSAGYVWVFGWFIVGLIVVEWWIRPYQHDSTASRPLSEVKHVRAWLVLRWGTTLESQVLYSFWNFLLHNIPLRPSFAPTRTTNNASLAFGCIWLHCPAAPSLQPVIHLPMLLLADVSYLHGHCHCHCHCTRNGNK